MRHHRKFSAFSLIEVVIALAVASVSLIAIIALLSVAASSSKASTDDTLIATMAVSVIDDMSKLYFVDNGTLTPHHITDSDILPGTSDVTSDSTPAAASPAPQIFFDVAGVRLKYTSGSNSGLDMIKVDALAAGAIYQCTETVQGDVNTLSATGTDGSPATQAVNLVNVILTFTWPVQATNPPNSKAIYASLARY
jgi:Tfp pilus assembly protein PilV